jgi:hypothetical protein
MSIRIQLRCGTPEGDDGPLGWGCHQVIGEFIDVWSEKYPIPGECPHCGYELEGKYPFHVTTEVVE